MKEHAVPKEGVSRQKILLIDDNSVDLELSSLMLEEHGFLVISRNSAVDCMPTIAAEKPDLVLLDIMMPDLDGNQALQLIRGQYTQIELPVIMVTSKSDASDVIVSLELGANDFISKPFEFRVAIKRIAAHILIARQSKKPNEMSELMAVNAMILTYNHEINNPLAIALGKLRIVKENPEKTEVIDEVFKALWRISAIVKKTHDVVERGSIEYEKYADTAKKLKLKD